MSDDSQRAIVAFWEWWPSVRAQIEAAIVDGNWGTLGDEIGARVDAIDDALQWEFGPGETADHALSLSPNGDVVRRRTTEAWARLAPPPDDRWEFHPARRSRLGTILRYEGHAFDPKDVLVAAELDEDRLLFDVTVFHAAFPAMGEDDRESATVLVLDGALGEDGVERWLGGIEAATAPPPNAVGLLAFLTEWA